MQRVPCFACNASGTGATTWTSGTTVVCQVCQGARFIYVRPAWN
jgi:hypothetical protein